MTHFMIIVYVKTGQMTCRMEIFYKEVTLPYSRPQAIFSRDLTPSEKLNKRKTLNPKELTSPNFSYPISSTTLSRGFGAMSSKNHQSTLSCVSVKSRLYRLHATSTWIDTTTPLPLTLWAEAQTWTCVLMRFQALHYIKSFLINILIFFDNLMQILNLENT